MYIYIYTMFMETCCPQSHVVDSTPQIPPLELLHKWHELHYLMSFPDAPMLSCSGFRLSFSKAKHGGL